MPLFKVGDFGQIGVSFTPAARVIKPKYKNTVKFSRTLSMDALSELSFNIEPPTMNLARSPNKWGLYLKSLSLFESFEGFIANLFNPTNEIYFTSITWDYTPNILPIEVLSTIINALKSKIILPDIGIEILPKLASIRYFDELKKLVFQK